MYTYNSDIIVEVVAGSTSAALQGSLKLTSINGITQYTINNPLNSQTEANFLIEDEDLYLNYLAEFTIKSNNCEYTLSVDLSNLETFPCETIISGVGGAEGDPIVNETCVGEFLLLGSEAQIYGCIDPNANNYDPLATISNGRCNYDGLLIGCTDPNSINYNPAATIDSGRCIPIVLGCTDPNSLNYNPDANVNDGTCIYNNNIKILGCTHPLASNYNINANFNDGSCIFLSGCTNSLADNFNENAVIDDGTCECNQLEVLFDLNNQSTFQFLSSGDTKCDYYLEFDYRLKINCEKFIDFFATKTDKTVLDLLSQIKLYSEVTIENNSYKQIELEIKKTDTVIPIELYGNDCNMLLTLVAEELGKNCPENVADFFKKEWRTARIKIPQSYLNTNVNVGFFLEGFSFGGNLLLDNVKLYRVCFYQKTECIVIPYNFGFKFEQKVDNKKSHSIQENEKLIFNTKRLDLRVDVENYIEKDVIQYINKNELILNKIYRDLTENKLKTNFISVETFLTDRKYCFLSYIYEQYLNNFKYCSYDSKKLGYSDVFKIHNILGDDWVNVIEQFIPYTAIWNKSSRYYKNLIFHNQKFKYQNYILTLSEDEDVDYNCTYVQNKECIDTDTFSYAYENVLRNIDGSCLISTKIRPTNYSNSNYGAGRLVQYNKTNLTYTKRYDFPNQEFETCL